MSGENLGNAAVPDETNFKYRCKLEGCRYHKGGKCDYRGKVCRYEPRGAK